jgi:hypothetical protein
MTREELQQATGLDAEVLDETLKALRGPDAHDDSYVTFEGDRSCLALCGPQSAERPPRESRPKCGSGSRDQQGQAHCAMRRETSVRPAAMDGLATRQIFSAGPCQQRNAA